MPCGLREFSRHIVERHQQVCYHVCLMHSQGEYRFWIYIMASHTGTLYTGVTGDLYVRVLQHKALEVEGFSATYKCVRLVYYEVFDDVLKAIAREKQIKRWRREKKIALIEKMQSALARPGGKLGKTYAVSRPAHGENSLNRPSGGHSLGVPRLRADQCLGNNFVAALRSG